MMTVNVFFRDCFCLISLSGCCFLYYSFVVVVVLFCVEMETGSHVKPVVLQEGGGGEGVVPGSMFYFSFHGILKLFPLLFGWATFLRFRRKRATNSGPAQGSESCSYPTVTEYS